MDTKHCNIWVPSTYFIRGRDEEKEEGRSKWAVERECVRGKAREREPEREWEGGERENALEMSLLLGTMAFFFFFFLFVVVLPQ